MQNMTKEKKESEDTSGDIIPKKEKFQEGKRHRGNFQ